MKNSFIPRKDYFNGPSLDAVDTHERFDALWRD